MAIPVVMVRAQNGPKIAPLGLVWGEIQLISP